MSPATERLPTDLALVRSLAGVQTLVTRQMTPLAERFPAFVTAVRPLPRVRLSMVYEMSGILGRVLTPLTLVPAVIADAFVTTLDVFLQTTLPQTLVVAVGTANSGVLIWR